MNGNNTKYVNETGRFEGVVVEHSIEELQNDNKTPYLKVSIDSDGEFAVAKLWLTPKALKYTLQKLQDLGWTGDDVILLTTPATQDNENDRDVSIRGVEVNFQVEQNEGNNGKIFYNVAGIYPKTENNRNRKKTVSGDVIKKLSARSKAEIKNLAKENDNE